MNVRLRVPVLILAIFALTAPALHAEYSPWSVFGGLNLIYNSNGSGVSVVPGMQSNGDPGGLQSAPSPLAGFLGLERRLTIPYSFKGSTATPLRFAPSASLWGVQYLWADGRPLPAEIENRTSYVASLFLDLPVLYTIEKNRFLWSFGLGPGVLARLGFLESGVSSDEKSYETEELTAGEQVKAINKYFWNSGRWLYPTVQAGVRYRLETGWGAGLTVRVGLPMANLWSGEGLPFSDSMMFMAALVITPPVRGTATVPAAAGVSDDELAPVAP